ncbi:MAG: anhydro-N-acetylmuramic acid kinase, partial [Colwellia sp.]|nr:anhydro-N-acetylmuramic acid kinase [Colwellia sp.]
MMNSINKPEYYIGLMSGTSADGIDLALVTFNSTGLPKLHASYYQAYSDEVASKITSLYGNTDNNSKNDELDRAFELDIQLAQLFAKAIKTLLQQTHLSAYEITAIGNHGQTIRHRPQVRYPFTLQIGCCQTLATLTNIRVIGQFRRKDMALGGQGAPLVPAFHEKVFSENAFNKDTINGGSSKQGNDIFVINIGGIANLTYLPATKNNTVIGYDTGSGNALMDDWFKRHNPKSEYNYDKNGDWAATGKINMVLLEQLLLDEYFQLA